MDRTRSLFEAEYPVIMHTIFDDYRSVRSRMRDEARMHHYEVYTMNNWLGYYIIHAVQLLPHSFLRLH